MRFHLFFINWFHIFIKCAALRHRALVIARVASFHADAIDFVVDIFGGCCSSFRSCYMAPRSACVGAARPRFSAFLWIFMARGDGDARHWKGLCEATGWKKGCHYKVQTALAGSSKAHLRAKCRKRSRIFRRKRHSQVVFIQRRNV